MICDDAAALTSIEIVDSENPLAAIQAPCAGDEESRIAAFADAARHGGFGQRHNRQNEQEDVEKKSSTHHSPPCLSAFPGRDFLARRCAMDAVIVYFKGE
jgi:hypothetical protein